jgi:hypothetical protein
MLSDKTRAIMALSLEVEQAARDGDFVTARDKQAELAGGEGFAPLMAEAVGRFIDRCREQQEKVA